MKVIENALSKGMRKLLKKGRKLWLFVTALLLVGCGTGMTEEELKQSLNGIYINREDKALLYLSPEWYWSMDAQTIDDELFVFASEELYIDYLIADVSTRTGKITATAYNGESDLSFIVQDDGKEIEFTDVFGDTQTYNYLGAWEDKEDFLLKELRKMKNKPFQNKLADFINASPAYKEQGYAVDFPDAVRYVFTDPELYTAFEALLGGYAGPEHKLTYAMALFALSIAAFHPENKPLLLGFPNGPVVSYFAAYGDNRKGLYFEETGTFVNEVAPELLVASDFESKTEATPAKKTTKKTTKTKSPMDAGTTSSSAPSKPEEPVEKGPSKEEIAALAAKFDGVYQVDDGYVYVMIADNKLRWVSLIDDPSPSEALASFWSSMQSFTPFNADLDDQIVEFQLPGEQPSEWALGSNGVFTGFNPWNTYPQSMTYLGEPGQVESIIQDAVYVYYPVDLYDHINKGYSNITVYGPITPTGNGVVLDVQSADVVSDLDAYNEERYWKDTRWHFFLEELYADVSQYPGETMQVRVHLTNGTVLEAATVTSSIIQDHVRGQQWAPY